MESIKNRTLTENNRATVKGQIADKFSFSHESYGEKFYRTIIEVCRTSENKDYIPLLVSERLVDVKNNLVGLFVEISGNFRSRNYRDETKKTHCQLFLFAKSWKELEYDEYENSIAIRGFVCKNRGYRSTPLGREIADFILAINRFYGKSDYIPCICWGRNAKFAESFNAGDEVSAVGRIQSREYQKLINGEKKTMTAYEVSISNIEKIESEEV